MTTTTTPRELLRRHGCRFHDGCGLIVVPHALILSDGIRAALDELCIRGTWTYEIAEKREHGCLSEKEFFERINQLQLDGFEGFAQGLLSLYRAAYGEGTV